MGSLSTPQTSLAAMRGPTSKGKDKGIRWKGKEREEKKGSEKKGVKGRNRKGERGEGNGKRGGEGRAIVTGVLRC